MSPRAELSDALVQARLDALLDDDAWSGDQPTEPGRVTPAPPLVARAQAVTAFGRAHVRVLLIVAALAVLFAAWTVLRARASTVPVAVEPSVGAPTAAAPTVVAVSPSASAASAEPQVVVHVVGAVRRPGVVRLAAGARVEDAIRAAGGLTRQAAPGLLNLAAPVADGSQIVVGRRGGPTSEVRDASAGSADTTGSPGTEQGSTVNLNTATAAQLDGLPGVGPVTAQKILDWRAQHGRFSRIEELGEVDGIGPKTYARLAPHVRV